MSTVRYVIVGGGMTAEAALRGIRSVDPSGEAVIIASEHVPPYNRPPLSKSLWKGEPENSIWRKSPGDHVELRLGRTATSIDPGRKTVTEREGQSYTYEKLLLATGGSVRRLSPEVEGIIYFRTLDDYHALRALCERGNTFAVIGGGFIGSEIAAALAMNDKSVAMIFPDPGIGARVYPATISHFLSEYFRGKGVEVRSGETVASISRAGARYELRTSTGRQMTVDGVVAGLGIEPNIDLARAARLTVDNGIRVDRLLRTSQRDIFAAGDVARFHASALDKFIRAEHEDNANAMGEVAGKNMAGAEVPYDHLPSFYSDLFDLGYEAVGELDAHLETFEDWKVEFREGVVYYLQNARVRGVLLWNVWGKVDEARALIAEHGPFRASDLKGRLTNS
ncbi:MAG TPA: FAD-dependent oxidoreductase [Bacteroidota bacterium]|nr:FAD-dependent oxidoreductase [Bacteroidota bacterium]